MSALPDILVPPVGANGKTGTYEVDLVFGGIKSLRDALAAGAPAGFAWQDWTPRLVVNDANGGNSWIPTSGWNPTLGTGSHVEGRYVRLADAIAARVTVAFGANAPFHTVTNFASDVSTEKLTSTAHGFTTGMAVIPTNLGTTVLPASTNADGIYYVVSATANDLQLALTAGGSAINLTGSNATGITLDQVVKAVATFASSITADTLTSTAHGFTNGQAVIPSGLTTTVLPAATNQDGSYYIVNAAANTVKLALTSGGAAVDITGTNSSAITLTAVAAHPGSGAYRLSLPVNCASAERAVTARADIGYGTIYNDSTAQATFGLGPNVYRHIDLHTAETITADVGGLLNTAGLPTTSLQGGYAVTTPVTNRAFTTTSVTTQQLAQVVGTILADLNALLAENVLVDVANSSPWVWAANDRISVKMLYEAA